MNKLVKMVSSLCLILCLAKVSLAKEWHGIVPLHSTREDVLRVLGKSTIGDDLYDVEEGRVNIMYSHRRCEQGLPADWGNWNVPSKEANSCGGLKIPDLDKLFWYEDDAGASYYRDKKEGTEYSVMDGKVIDIAYGPTEKDKSLLCNKNAPEIKH